MTILLALNLVAAIATHYFHATHPFSNGWSVAQIMKSPPYNNDVPYVGYPDSMAITVAGYLGKPFYYPSQESYMQYFPKWGTRFRPSQSEVIIFANYVSFKQNSPVFFVTTMSTIDPRMKLVLKTEGSIVKDEDFYLYLLDSRSIQ